MNAEKLTWKLDEENKSSNAVNHVNFGQAIKSIARGAYVPDRKTYAPFRRIFHEDPLNNPALQSANQTYAYDAHFKEQEAHWKRNGAGFTLPVEERFPVFSTEPTRPDEFPFLSYKGEKYWGRERRVNSYCRAKIYSHSTERLRHDAIKVLK